MTTYEQGRAPEGAPVTWRSGDRLIRFTTPENRDTFYLNKSMHDSDDAERICRAFHVAKLAEDYAKAKAAMDAAATAAEMESVRAAYYDAARALCEAVR